MNLDLNDALRLAINVLRDSAESRRMPNGSALAPAEVELHSDAADLLEDTRRQLEDAGQLPPHK